MHNEKEAYYSYLKTHVYEVSITMVRVNLETTTKQIHFNPFYLR
jgi:hypothetical protein